MVLGSMAPLRGSLGTMMSGSFLPGVLLVPILEHQVVTDLWLQSPPSPPPQKQCPVLQGGSLSQQLSYNFRRQFPCSIGQKLLVGVEFGGDTDLMIICPLRPTCSGLRRLPGPR